MKILRTVCDREFKVDDEDAIRLEGYTFHRVSKYIYAYKPATSFGAKNQEREYLHRVILNIDDGEVDHKDGDPLNNQKENLRRATRSEQLYNHPSRTEYTKGVIKIASTGKYHARIYVKDKGINLGYYTELQDAIDARLSYEEEHGIYVRRK